MMLFALYWPGPHGSLLTPTFVWANDADEAIQLGVERPGRPSRPLPTHYRVLTQPESPGVLIFEAAKLFRVQAH